MAHRTGVIAAAFALLAFSAACGGGDGQPAPTASSQIVNGGFENGRVPWFVLKPPEFNISDAKAHSGIFSAQLELRGNESDRDTKIAYLVQEMQPAEFPDVLSGYYYVDNWKKGTGKQYLQFVVVAFAPKNFPEDISNYQIRYLLAGIDSPPFDIANAKFIFDSKEDPPVGQWVKFEHNVKEDFKRLWDKVPEDFDNIRLLFEVRYDDKAAGEGPAEADVYYDDLYFGPP